MGARLGDKRSRVAGRTDDVESRFPEDVDHSFAEERLVLPHDYADR
jgi:hypothetical protein